MMDFLSQGGVPGAIGHAELLLAQASAQPKMLVSLWKPLVLLIPFVPWAWFVSKVLDKHAERFILPRNKWNAIHLCVGLTAVVIGLSMPFAGPGAFWAGLGAMIVILSADVLVFMHLHNADERTPENHRLNLLEITNLAGDETKKKDKADAKGQGKSEFMLKAPDKSVITVPQAETPEYQIRLAAEKLYLSARSARGSQVTLMPISANQYQAQMLVDGVPVKLGEAMPGADAVKVMDLWKSAAKLDLADRRKKLTGDATVEKDDRKTKVRVTSEGSQQGMKVTLLFDPEEAVKRASHELGLLEQQVTDLKALVDDEKGTVLLVAPADNGRTTTMYALARMHDAYTKNVQTVEMEPQLTLEGVRQNKFEAGGDGPEYSTLVRSILRREPDVLAVADLPDAQTAKEIARAEKERVRTYVSVKAESVYQAVQGWVKLVGDAEQAGDGLRGVVSQKLLRKLCTKCRTPYAPSADMLKRMGLPADGVKQLFKKSGKVVIKDKEQECPMCHGVGFLGQEGVFEVIMFTDAERELVKSGDWNGLKLEVRKRKVPTLQQAALRKVLDGTTSVEEMLRVTTDQAQQTPGAPAAGASGGAPAPAGGTVNVKPQSPPAQPKPAVPVKK